MWCCPAWFHGTAAVACAVALVWSVPARAADSWNRIQSTNFVVVGELGHGRLATLARTLEQFRLATTQLFPTRLVQADHPLTVVVLRHGNMRNYDPSRSGNVAGFYRSTPEHDYIVMADVPAGGADLRTILHEYQHSITRNTWRDLPRWVNEGVAEFYSTFQTNADGSRYTMGRPIASHLNTLRTSGSVGLDQFFADDGRSVRMGDRFRVDVFYAQSWALVHFFVLGDQGKWSSSFPRFVQALATGEEPAAAFRRTVTSDIQAFQDRFRSYVTLPALPAVAYSTTSEVNEVVNDQSTRGTLTVAETETLKARLLNDTQKSTKALADALTASPNHRPALTLRAELLLLQGRDTPKAAEELTNLVRADATDARLCGLGMFALNVLSRSEEALSLCPDNATPHAGTAFERVVALETLGQQAVARPFYATLAAAEEEKLEEIYWRAWRYLEEGHYPASVRASDLWVARATTSPDRIGYLRLVRTVARCLQRFCDDAKADLRQKGIPPGAGEWLQQVYRFETGVLNADALLKAASRKEEETEARVYIALDLLSGGRTDEALPHLRWVVDRGSRDVTEYFVATAHYKRLTADTR